MNGSLKRSSWHVVRLPPRSHVRSLDLRPLVLPPRRLLAVPPHRRLRLQPPLSPPRRILRPPPLRVSRSVLAPLTRPLSLPRFLCLHRLSTLCPLCASAVTRPPLPAPTLHLLWVFVTLNAPAPLLIACPTPALGQWTTASQASSPCSPMSGSGRRTRICRLPALWHTGLSCILIQNPMNLNRLRHISPLWPLQLL